MCELKKAFFSVIFLAKHEKKLVPFPAVYGPANRKEGITPDEISNKRI